MELWELSAWEISEKVKAKEVSAQEVLEAHLSRIAEVDPSICSFLSVLEAEARIAASRVDAKIAGGEDPGILAGVPCALKDNLNLRGTACTCASKILDGYISPYTATAVARLIEQGAVITGKTNMDEFAMGSSTERSAFMVTRNPWDTDRAPGGSSGGSAAAVAAGLSTVALGSDTGGSIRQPAAFTGIVGLKPTYGRVSRYGLVAFASSLDQIGPFARDVRDAALVLEAMAGFDPADATSSDRPVVPWSKRLERPVKGLRAGVPKELLGFGVSEGVKSAFYSALERLAGMGVIVEETSLPSLAYALDVYYVIAPAEASSNLSRFDGVRYGLSKRGKGYLDMYRETRGEGFGPEVRRRIMLGTFALSADQYEAYYLRAAKIRTLIRRDFERAFQSYDVLLSPTTPTVAFKIGEESEDPMTRYMADVMTVSINLAGLPAVSVPCGFAEIPDGAGKEMPCGLQIIGKPFDEETVLAAAYAVESFVKEELEEKSAQMRRNLLLAEECEPVD
ncbi:MAG TPA: Asp-tRNA(Asn)/Glu-tRNA(Gln) amidotransferase subunit GatA [Firmicutes bacterium]|nr:Asp-tRNA(Asn)/Glu-tRNA(Gln) amidotransferase subunit GatA [Candidatus Fermentithermobacillaceae bacterium]